jgi:hypothetical protein
MAEVAVHFSLATMPEDNVMITIDIPDTTETMQLEAADLPTGWKDFPHPPSTQKIGDDFVNENK